MNVASIAGFLPGPLMATYYASKNYVAKYTIKKFLKNKFYIIPGFQIKCVKFFSKFIPTPILAKCTYYMQKRKEG